MEQVHTASRRAKGERRLAAQLAAAHEDGATARLAPHLADDRDGYRVQPSVAFSPIDALGELYDGHLAEGNLNITSEPLRQIHEAHDDVQALEDDILIEELQDNDIEVIESKVQADKASREQEAAAQKSRQDKGRRMFAAIKQDKKDEKDSKKAKTSRVEGLMESYLNMRTKQMEPEAVLLAKENQLAQDGTDFSIKRCISVLNKMEVTSLEKVKAYSVFKSADNREIFLSSYEEYEDSALMCFRSEMAP